ncbi:MAG TPA: GAF domain-containing SpoIIE family protein phosphatase [Actinomycetota bacterium]|nr:GAF domain-containing SpoIIE family protein phosphatase [Actinomycetota bacterium]
MDPKVLAPPTTDEQILALQADLEALREEAAITNLLLGLGAALSEVKSVEDTIGMAVKLVPDVLGGDRCFAAIWNNDGPGFHIRAHFGFDEDGLRILHELAGTEGALPLLERAVKEKRPQVIGDVANDRRNLGYPPDRTPGAFVAIPLVRWGHDLGALAVEFDDPRNFGNKDEGLARGIARQISIALANARRFTVLGDLRNVGLRLGSKLRLREVIDEISGGVMDLLGADAAVLYFMDASERELVAAEGANSLEEGGLSRIDLKAAPWSALLRGETVGVSDAGPLSVAGRKLNAVAVPLTRTAGAPVGAVIAFLTRPLPLGAEEEEALTVLAAQAAMAIETASRFEQQRRVAESLQAGLLSTPLPALPGCQIAAVYEPAGGEAEIGGDFFDVFEVTTGSYSLVVGDVSGKGAEAAAHTAMAKYMLRAFAIRNASPTSVLFHLNNALVDGFSDERFATLFYGVFEPANRQLQLSSGGHPESLVYRAASGDVETLTSAGTILGAFADQQFEQHVVTLQPGDVVLSYTDGLIEARDHSDLFGAKRLADALREHASEGLSAQSLARRIYEHAREFGDITDDTIVLVLACDP